MRILPQPLLFAFTLALAGCLADPAPPAEEGYALEPVAEGFGFLAQFAFAPDGRVFYTERLEGEIRIVEDGTVEPQAFATFSVADNGEQGLLGVALHPEYPGEPWVYAYYTYEDGGTWNRLVRVRDEGGTGGEVQVLLDRIPGARYHDGGAIAFGPDDMLWVTTGEAHARSPAQDPDALGGKVHRLTPEGDPAPGNPFGADNPAYAMGLRNVFGIAFDAEGTPWITENGPERDDEINRLDAGANYGWPEVTGRADDPRFEDPQWIWGSTIAPTGMAFPATAYPSLKGDVLVGDWKTGHLRRLHRAEGGIVNETTLASLEAGIVDVEPDGEGTIHVASPHALYRLVAANP